MTDRSSTVWETIRRALGRLVSGVSVKDLPEGQFSMRLHLGARDVLKAEPCRAGRKEREWRPQAQSVLFCLPTAQQGGQGTDLAVLTAVIGMEGALTAESTPVQQGQLPAREIAVHPFGLLEVDHRELSVRSELMKLTMMPGPSVSVFSPPVVVERLKLEAPRLARKRSLLNARYSAEEGQAQLPAFSRIRVRPSWAAAAVAPVTRVPQAPPPGVRAALAFAAERRQLAQANKVALEDVMLLGVYSHVPLSAVRRLGLGDDGETLSLWLKPEALATAADGKPLRLSTLIIGRERSSGRMIQSVA